MKRICEFCEKEYEVDISLGNWDKENKQNKIKKWLISSERFCCYECGKKYKTNMIKKTKLERYGTSNYNNSLKNKNTRLKNNNGNYKSLKEIKKYKNTMLERYGVEYPHQNNNIKNKIKFTCLNKYGSFCSLHGIEIKEKVRNTNLNKYGVENFAKSKKYKDLYKNKDWENLRQKHRYETLKKNNSFNASKPEEQIYKLLLQKYSQVERQYKSNLYPFNCDFYIPSLDLYIEYQGYWTHGTKQYNKDDEECIKILNIWRIRSEENNFKNESKNQYLNAIKVWTILDPLKRQIARENNLNWIEFFNITEFLEWYNKV